LCDDEGFTYLWKPRKLPTLTKNGLKVLCRQFFNVPVIFPTVAEPGGSASRSNNRYNALEDDDEDEEMPNLGDSSSDEEGWTSIEGKKKKKPVSSEKVNKRSRP